MGTFTDMILQAWKIAVTCKPLFHQGRGLSKNKTARLDFEKSAVCIGFVVIPHVVWSKSIRTMKRAVWRAKRRENGRFRKISPVFSSLNFSEYHRSL